MGHPEAGTHEFWTRWRPGSAKTAWETGGGEHRNAGLAFTVSGTPRPTLPSLRTETLRATLRSLSKLDKQNLARCSKKWDWPICPSQTWTVSPSAVRVLSGSRWEKTDGAETWGTLAEGSQPHWRCWGQRGAVGVGCGSGRSASGKAGSWAPIEARAREERHAYQAVNTWHQAYTLRTLHVPRKPSEEGTRVSCNQQDSLWSLRWKKPLLLWEDDMLINRLVDLSVN